MIRSSLCDYGDVYIFVKGITVPKTAAQDGDVKNTNKKVIFKDCAPFTSCKTEINNIQVDNTKDIDIVMPTYNLIEYSNNAIIIRRHQEVYGSTIGMNLF